MPNDECTTVIFDNNIILHATSYARNRCHNNIIMCIVTDDDPSRTAAVAIAKSIIDNALRPLSRYKSRASFNSDMVLQEKLGNCERN